MFGLPKLLIGYDVFDDQYQLIGQEVNTQTGIVSLHGLVQFILLILTQGFDIGLIRADL